MSTVVQTLDRRSEEFLDFMIEVEKLAVKDVRQFRTYRALTTQATPARNIRMP